MFSGLFNERGESIICSLDWVGCLLWDDEEVAIDGTEEVLTHVEFLKWLFEQVML